MALRDHKPIDLTKFNGLWDQGDQDSVPQDHFSDCENIRFVDANTFATRHGLGRHQTVAAPLGNIVRIYNYVMQTGNTLLVLTYDGTTGKIYHVVNSTTLYGPILTIVGMMDFGFIPFAGRAYITPFATYSIGGLNVEKGMLNEFLYVYRGNGTAATKAAGAKPVGTISMALGSAGNTDGGLHLFGVVFETDTGYLSAPSAFAAFTTNSAFSVSFSNIPVSPDSNVIKRHIVSTIIINGYNGDLEGYQYFFIPNGTINDNVATVLPNISYYDADLFEDASYLIDNYAEIPAGVGLCLYHNRLCLFTTYNDISLVLVSTPGEPEAISQIDGLLIVSPDGNPITNAQEMRDVLYGFKRNKTFGWIDNGDVPSSWPLSVIDMAIGTSVHGIATVIDSGSTSIDYLIIASFRGVYLFNGKYSLPELSMKISAFWLRQDSNESRRVQILNDPIEQVLYITLPDRRLLIGDYNNGFDAKKIRWVPWRFDVMVSTIALTNINDLIIGAEAILI